jgi:hypothetical protein
MRIICMGYNDVRFLGEGWYGLEKSPENILYRASAPLAEIYVATRRAVELSLLLSARPAHVGEPLRVSVQGEAGSRFDCTLDYNGWTLRKGWVVPDSEGMVRFLAQNPWSPDRLYDNGDARALGILVSAIRIG